MEEGRKLTIVIWCMVALCYGFAGFVIAGGEIANLIAGSIFMVVVTIPVAFLQSLREDIRKWIKEDEAHYDH